MARVRLVAVLALIIGTSSAVQAEPKPTTDGVQEVRAAIEAANARFTEAFARGDATALAGLYTPEAIAFPPDSEMIRGNDAIGKFWKAQRDGGVQTAVLKTFDVGRSGDLAWEDGKVSLTIQSPGQQPTKAEAKYVVVWQRQADGAWKMQRDIWNSLPATK